MTVRAPRFATQLAMRYRPSGEIHWYEARTENLSSTGVLFRGERALKRLAPVEMRIQMLWLRPLQPAGLAEIVWRGSVVRRVLPTEKGELPALAATISQQLFLSSKTSLEV